METGKKTIEEGDGSEAQFYFASTGKGYTGVQNGSLYYMGKLQTAESGTKYEVISVPNGNGYTNYVVNGSGKIVKSTSGVKNNDGVKYYTTSGGVLTKIDDDPVDSSAVFREAIEPVWD